MDVSQKIDPQTKARLGELQIECQVLQNLLKERNAALQELVKQILISLTPNPTQYGLRVDASKDEWELQLAPGALIIPDMNQRLNRVGRRALQQN